MNKHIKTSGARNLVPDVLLKVCSENSVLGLFISPPIIRVFTYISTSCCTYYLLYRVPSLYMHL